MKQVENLSFPIFHPNFCSKIFLGHLIWASLATTRSVDAANMTEEEDKKKGADYTHVYKYNEDEVGEGNKASDISDANFQDKVAQAVKRNILLVVQFHGPKCPACRSVAEFFNVLAINHPHQLFCKINVRQNKEIATAARIEFLPTFIYYKDGIEVDREVGTNCKLIEKKVNMYKTNKDVDQDEAQIDQQQ